MRRFFLLLSAVMLVSCAGKKPGVTAISQNISVQLKYIMKFGSPGGAVGSFVDARGISVDKSGNVYVADTGNNRVQKFNPQGKPLKQIGGFGGEEEGLREPTDVWARTSLEIYVVDSQNRRIQQYDRYLSTIGTIQFLSGNGQGAPAFSLPTGVAVSRHGDIYLTDRGNGVVYRIDSFGKVERSFGGFGYGIGELSGPTGVAVDRDGNVYVCDTDNDRIVKFDSFGSFDRSIGKGELFRPHGIDISLDKLLFMADTDNHRIVVFNRKGKVVTTFGARGDGPASFESPFDLTLSGQDILYVMDTGNGRVQKLEIQRKTLHPLQ